MNETNEKITNEKNVNPKLKEFSMQDLCDEIANRSKLMVVATDETIKFKAGCDLFQLMGLTFKALMEAAFILKNEEMKAKAGGIVPASGIPRGTPPGFGH